MLEKLLNSAGIVSLLCLFWRLPDRVKRAFDWAFAWLNLNFFDFRCIRYIRQRGKRFLSHVF